MTELPFFWESPEIRSLPFDCRILFTVMFRILYFQALRALSSNFNTIPAFHPVNDPLVDLISRRISADGSLQLPPNDMTDNSVVPAPQSISILPPGTADIHAAAGCRQHRFGIKADVPKSSGRFPHQIINALLSTPVISSGAAIPTEYFRKCRKYFWKITDRSSRMFV